MKKINKLVLLAMLPLVWMISCQPKSEDDFIEATLMTSINNVMLNNKGAATTVAITTNQKKWMATSPVEGEWLILEQSGNDLFVEATENSLGKDRSTYILVQAGPMYEKINVTQSAADIVLEVSPDVIDVPSDGGEYLLDVRSNTDTWVINKEDENVNWLEIKYISDFAQIIVEESTEKNSRVAKLYANNGKITREILVLQSGVGYTQFALPLLNPAPLEIEMRDYESKVNNSYFKEYTKPYVDPYTGQQYNGYFKFLYSSPVFDEEVTYTIFYGLNLITEISMSSSSGADLLLSDEYANFLRENGFANVKLDKGRELTAQKEAELALYDVEVKPIPNRPKSATVVFTVTKIIQNKAYPTAFKKFPYDVSYRLNNPDWTWDTIKKAEKADESVVVDIPSVAMITATLNESKHPLYQRVYAFYGANPDRQLWQLFTAWNDYTMGAWQLPNGTLWTTDEFVQLMLDEGFVFFGKSVQGFEVFQHSESGLYASPHPMWLNGIPVFGMNYLYDITGNQESITSYSKEEKLEQLSKYFDNIDLLLKGEKQNGGR